MRGAGTITAASLGGGNHGDGSRKLGDAAAEGAESDDQPGGTGAAAGSERGRAFIGRAGGKCSPASSARAFDLEAALRWGSREHLDRAADGGWIRISRGGEQTSRIEGARERERERDSDLEGKRTNRISGGAGRLPHRRHESPPSARISAGGAHSAPAPLGVGRRQAAAAAFAAGGGEGARGRARGRAERWGGETRRGEGVKRTGGWD